MFTQVVVPLDGSSLAAAALGPARALAARTGASLLLLTAWWGDDERRAEERLDGYLTELGYERARAEVVHDPVIARAILAWCGQGSLVCMSTHGRSGVGEAVLGSVAEEVVRESEAPVLLVGPSVERGVWASELWFRDGTLLVAVDGSQVSLSVLPVAREWAEVLDLSTRVVEVVPAPMGIQLRPDRPEDSHAGRRAAETLAAIEGSPDWELLYGEDVATALIDYVSRRSATMLAMATHAKRGLARVALGSVTMHVVHHSPVPVLVVRPVQP